MTEHDSDSGPRRPSHATVVAYAALFVALTGTAWAATKIGAGDIRRDAVRAKHIRADAVRADEIGADAVGAGEIGGDAVGAGEIGPDAVGSGEIAAAAVQRGELGAGAVDGSKVANDALTGDDIDEETLTNVEASTLGGRPPTGFISSTYYQRSSPTGAGVLLVNGYFTDSVSCDLGDRVISGGPSNVSAPSVLVQSAPAGTTGWAVTIDKRGGTDTFSTTVICADQP